MNSYQKSKLDQKAEAAKKKAKAAADAKDDNTGTPAPSKKANG